MKKTFILIALATLLLGGCASTQSYRSAGNGVYYSNPVVNVGPSVGFGVYSYPWYFISRDRYRLRGAYYGYMVPFLNRHPFTSTWYQDIGLEYYLNPPYGWYETPPARQSVDVGNNQPGHKGKYKGSKQVAKLHGNNSEFYSGYYPGAGVGALRPEPVTGVGSGKWLAPPQRLHGTTVIYDRKINGPLTYISTGQRSSNHTYRQTGATKTKSKSGSKYRSRKSVSSKSHRSRSSGGSRSSGRSHSSGGSHSPGGGHSSGSSHSSRR